MINQIHYRSEELDDTDLIEYSVDGGPVQSMRRETWETMAVPELIAHKMLLWGRSKV